jgi:SAM-dependent methyltransferase
VSAVDDRTFAAFQQLHRGLPRQGPGSAETTRRAFAALGGLPPRPRIVDVGCGPGAQTLELARLGNGPIVAVDLQQPFLDELRERAAAAGVSDRIEVVRADMNRLAFEPGSLDLLWSEGAIYIMGFEHGLRAWRPLLCDGGQMAVTEATWLRSDPPEELRRFWQESYPGMNGVEANLAVARGAGYQVLGSFALPERCWWEYYEPIAARLEGWLERSPGDEGVRAVVEAERREIDLYRRYSSYYGYVFYLLQRC